MISENARYWIWISQSLGYNSIKVKRISELYSILPISFQAEKKSGNTAVFLRLMR